MTAALLTPAFRRIPFQLDGIARTYLSRQKLVVWDLGCGKGSLGIAIGAEGLARGDADLVLIVCERSKLTDWEDEFGRFTAIPRVLVYHGPGRHKKLAEQSPQVLISTYETLRQDVAKFETKRKLRDGPLMEHFRTRRLIIIYDEISKLGNRNSGIYRAQNYMLTELRKKDQIAVAAGLTGTPIEKDWENAYNELRLLVPWAMPKVGDFEKKYIRGHDDYRRPLWRHAAMPEFAALCAPHILRKKKTDPDVVGEFPEETEEFIRPQMHEDQKRVYRLVEDLAWTEDGFREVKGLDVVLRMVAGHPASLRHANSRLGRMLWEELSAKLEACSSAKTEELISYLGKISSQGDKALVFTFFGQSVLHELTRELDGFRVFPHHGQMSPAELAAARDQFLSHDGPAVLLSSDTGKRGLNIPVPYVIEYEPGRTHADRVQRFGRGSRLGHGGEKLSCITFALEGTVETRRAMRRALDRNEQADILLGENTVTDRRLLFACARKRAL